MAAIESLKQMVDAAFARIERRWSGWLPFRGKYLAQAKALILANLDQLKAQVEAFFGSDTESDYAAMVRMLMLLLRGNIRGWWAGLFLDQLERFLIENREMFRGQIGAAAEMKPHD